MVQTMICFWWTIMAISVYMAGAFAWDIRLARKSVLRANVNGLVGQVILWLVIATLSGSTICAMHLADGGW